MMAKITKGSSFKGVIKYIIDEKKKSQILDADGLRLKSISSVIGSFVTQAEMNGRVSKTVGHISLDFSAQDKDKISNRFMVNVARDYMKQMGICNTQYILVRHFDKEHPHVHLVFNRVDYNGRVISDSNDRYRSEKICKDITHKHGLYFSTGKENVKLHRLKEPDKSKYEIYNVLKESVPKCRNWQELTRELHKAGIETEFKTKGNTAIIEGVRFRKGDYVFNGSKVDRMFSYSKIDFQLKQNERLFKQQVQTQSEQYAVGTESITSGLGGLFDLKPEYPNKEDQEYLYQPKKKKKKRRYGRQM